MIESYEWLILSICFAGFVFWFMNVIKNITPLGECPK